MIFTEFLLSGTLVKRYKRFFVDVKVNNKILTAHCPNSGSMLGLLDKNNKVWISKSDNPNRKLKYTLELIKVKNELVGINTHLANKIVLEALKENKITEFKNFTKIKPEAVFDKKTRFDFFIEKSKKKFFLEVKNVTLSLEENIAEFPDAITSRGTRHLLKLLEAKEKGYGAYLLFLIQRQNCNQFKIAENIDAVYKNTFAKVVKKGVKVLCYNCKLTPLGIKVNKPIKIL